MSGKESRVQQIYDREGRNTSSSDPKMMNARVFIGNLASDKLTRQDIMKLFQPHGKVLGVSLHRSYGFVQFENEKDAKEAVKATNGVNVEGLRIDVNIATERRKETGGPERPLPPRGGRTGGHRGRRSPSPPFRPSRHDRYDMERPPPPWWERERMGWRGSPPPMGGNPYHHDRERDFDRFPPPHMRGEPYGRPRDDPYERYPPPPRDRERFGPTRDFYGSPRDNYPPLDRYSYDYPPPPRAGGRRGSPPPTSYDRGGLPERDRFSGHDEWEREKRAAVLVKAEGGGGGEGRSVDMELIVINRQQRDYASVVSGRVQELGLVVQTQQLSPTVSLADALDSAAQQGLLYAIIITSQHELHRSVTLTILHGRNPQEHKNMPMEDALSLVSKDFEHYMMSGRPALGPRRAAQPDVSHLLGKAASGGSLSSSELSVVISALQKQKQDDTSSHNVAPVAEKVMNTNTPEDIQRQQADLQAKILSLLGSSAVVPSSSSAPTSASGVGGSKLAAGDGFESLAGRGAAAGGSVNYAHQSGGYARGYGTYGGVGGGGHSEAYNRGGGGYGPFGGYQ